MSLDATLAHIDAQLDPALARLMKLMRIPSISTDPAYDPDCDRAADWLVADLQSMGFDASKRVTPGHPMVVAHADGPGPHVLFYGHYDVQPVDPLELWNTPPFEPSIEDTPRGAVIRGRGAVDDKGQLMTFLEACRAWRATTGALPCKISIIFEGEEESGSPSLVPFLEAHAEELRADVALICDTGLYGHDTPAITTMLRGMVMEEITVHGPTVDLHSGSYGGLAMNPIRVLNRILSNLHDDQGRIQIPGFYDGIPEITPEVRAQWEALNFDVEAYLCAVGLRHPAGEQDRTPLEMNWARPTAEVNGIWGGYTGAGYKTVLPAHASAKISFRLVAGQDPEHIKTAWRDWVQGQLPDDCRVDFANGGAAPASAMDLSHPAFEATRAALSDEWPKPAAFVGSGGSIPIAGYFQTILGMQSVLAGFGRDDDGMHSPNEKYDVECFHKGTRSWARILDALARQAG